MNDTCRHCDATIAWDAEWRMWEHVEDDTALCEVNGRTEIAEPYVAPLGKETTMTCALCGETAARHPVEFDPAGETEPHGCEEFVAP